LVATNFLGCIGIRCFRVLSEFQTIRTRMCVGQIWRFRRTGRFCTWFSHGACLGEIASLLRNPILIGALWPDNCWCRYDRRLSCHTRTGNRSGRVTWDRSSEHAEDPIGSQPSMSSKGCWAYLVTQASSEFSGQASVGNGCIAVAPTTAPVPVAGLGDSCEAEVVNIEGALLFMSALPRWAQTRPYP
jgi:hypothetical protein